jgi:hypothetical protein
MAQTAYFVMAMALFADEDDEEVAARLAGTLAGWGETGNAQLKTYLRGPGKILRSASPDMVKQELWGYLLACYAISALICTAATAAGIDPDRVKFKRTVRVIRRRGCRERGSAGTT